MRHYKSSKLLELARMMIKQAKILRDAGLVREARQLARRARLLDDLGWAINGAGPAPALAPVRTNPFHRR